MNTTINRVTRRIEERSKTSRSVYLARMEAARRTGGNRSSLSCGNLAHGFAAAEEKDKAVIRNMQAPNIAIVSSYNDMLSAHQPLNGFPFLIKEAVRQNGCTAQFAGGVPAMCDGVTQGQPGMELSLFSRDTIALATAVALSHNMFDGVLCLGVCDKIVPGLLIGALSFGHLPAVFVPGGPMPSGLPNKEKQSIRQQFAEGKVGRDELLEAESRSYHAPGTCTFYGTANSNQMLMEVMGLHLPGASFVNPNTPLRNALTREAARRITTLTDTGDSYTPLARLVSEKSIVNGIVGLLATGGSSNHTLHLVAMAKAAGIVIDWQDFDDLSEAVPLLTRIYPNGSADVNHFHAAGGMAFLIRELLEAQLLHADIPTVFGHGMADYTRVPVLDGDQLRWDEGPVVSGDRDILRETSDPFDTHGGIRLIKGNLGRGVTKTSAVSKAHRIVEAPARVFHDQNELKSAFENGELSSDMVAVVRFQGPQANGMPELHKLTPYLGVLQDRGLKVALVTDGRMSGASGKVPAAIHMTPESACGGAIARVRDGDLIRLDLESGQLDVQVDASEFARRAAASEELDAVHSGLGRELFALMRNAVSSSEEGACSLFGKDEVQRD